MGGADWFKAVFEGINQSKTKRAQPVIDQLSPFILVIKQTA
jgi:hypothetical protein